MYSKRSSGSSAVSSRTLMYLWKAVNLLSRSASPLSAPLRYAILRCGRKVPISIPHRCSLGGAMCFVSMDVATAESVYTVVGWYVMSSAQCLMQSRMAPASLSKAA